MSIYRPTVTEMLFRLLARRDLSLFLVLEYLLTFLVFVLALSLFNEREAKGERLIALTKILEEKDPYTFGHSTRVADYSVKIGQALGMPARKIEILRLAALCHDLGKIFVPIDVLNKPGSLVPEEWQAMKEHPVDSQRLFNKFFPQHGIGTIILYHHERWDGKGYPDGLHGEEIPYLSRIIAVADTFDALTSRRPYREAMPLERALRIIEENAGTQLDPHIVEVALHTLESAVESYEPLADRAPVPLA